MTEQAGTRAAHWNAVYGRLDDTQVSWYEPDPTSSLAMLDTAGVDPGMSVIDVGAGASRLADALLARGFGDVTALDVSDDGLAHTRARLGAAAAERVAWVVADLLGWVPQRRYQVWHDRAVFHFLTDPADQARYRDLLHAALRPDARVIIATFADDGPRSCSGLPTARYSPTQLGAVLGSSFDVIATRREHHRTPAGAIQPFTWLAAHHHAIRPAPVTVDDASGTGQRYRGHL
ncbi:class I SAM-dependent methyltransferase [Pseudonocardia sp. GCM10023141]|uniref:class I SAM-dependent methyltransferase n=1 Tax=Pseudonocardia sp. GCM10023141 TaxID=3252653 RepID=UPI00361D80A1